MFNKAERTRRTTTLPSSLLEQIEASNGNGYGRGRKTRSRKETRKLERSQRNERKANYFNTAGKRKTVPQLDMAPPAKRPKLDPAQNIPKPTSTLPTKSGSRNHSKPSASNAPLLQPSRSTHEIQEDAYIEYLESKLNHKKGKKAVRHDGLDDLLDFAESFETSNLSAPRSDDTPPLEGSKAGVSTAEDSEAEWDGIHSLDPSSDEESFSSRESASSEKEPEPYHLPPAAKYVPPQSRQAASHSDEADVRIMRQLKGLLNRLSEQNIASIVDSIEEVYRNCQRAEVTSTLSSLLVDGIASHALLLESYVVLHAALVSSLHKIIGTEFTAHFVQKLISAYEKQLSSALLSTPSPEDGAPGGKEPSNLIIFLSELYNFQVVSCILVFDVIRSLLENDMNELIVEILLQLLRSSGGQLRQDDPSALKEIVRIVQDKLSIQGSSINSRTRFMADTLANLKSNKIKQRPDITHKGGDSVVRMKKFLSGLGKRKHVLSQEPLRFTLADLRSADVKGKWWIVGAAWGGNPLVERAEKETVKRPNPSESSLLKLAKKHGMNSDIRRSIFVVIMSSDDYVDACEKLLELKLSEIQQREIIRVLLHCCGNEKSYNPYYALIATHLAKDSHSAKVTLQYALWDFLRDLGDPTVGGTQVVKNQDGSPSSFGISGKASGLRLQNVAKTFAWMVAKGSLSLLILKVSPSLIPFLPPLRLAKTHRQPSKPLDFTKLKESTREFLQIFLSNMFAFSHTKSPSATYGTVTGQIASGEVKKDRKIVEEIFLQAAKHEGLAMGLTYYFGHWFEKDEAFTRWAVGVAKETLRMGIEVIAEL